MTREFSITSDIIAVSSRQSPTNCPLGLALQAGGVTVHEIGYNFISCSFIGRRFLLPMPAACFEFLRRHDTGAPVSPITFSITFLEEAPRPLPDRFAPSPMPKAPPFPEHPGMLCLARTIGPALGRMAHKIPALFGSEGRQTAHYGG